MLSNRILSVRIVGESKGTALVGMVDQASDPQADVAELLISIGYAAAATSPPDTEDTDTPGVEGAAAEGRTLVVGVVLLSVEDRGAILITMLIKLCESSACYCVCCDEHCGRFHGFTLQNQESRPMSCGDVLHVYLFLKG